MKIFCEKGRKNKKNYSFKKSVSGESGFNRRILPICSMICNVKFKRTFKEEINAKLWSWNRIQGMPNHATSQLS